MGSTESRAAPIAMMVPSEAIARTVQAKEARSSIRVASLP